MDMPRAKCPAQKRSVAEPGKALLLPLSHPDYTVGPGLSPDLLTPPNQWWALAGCLVA